MEIQFVFGVANAANIQNNQAQDGCVSLRRKLNALDSVNIRNFYRCIFRSITNGTFELW